MRQLRGTLYIMTENSYLSLDGENIVVNQEGKEVSRRPLHNLQSIVTFAYPGASPALLGKCAEMGIAFTFCTPKGQFLARSVGKSNGNVLLRRTQYRIADDEFESCKIAKHMIFGKIYNCRQRIERIRRDHAMRVNERALTSASSFLKSMLPMVESETNLDALRGLEGVAANSYFGIFDEMILNGKELFRFKSRNRRPPLDLVNALLSMAYSALTRDCASALETAGLDSYVGFLHRDRPGRVSLSLDLMEELRPCIADRFVLYCINNRMFNTSDFDFKDSGAVFLKDDARRKFYKEWSEMKREDLHHPYHGEKLQWGMVAFAQAQLLSRYLRGDIDAYPPFLYK